MRNCKDIRDWFVNVQGPTDLIMSDFRPVPLLFKYADRTGISNLFDKLPNKRGQPRLNRRLLPGFEDEQRDGSGFKERRSYESGRGRRGRGGGRGRRDSTDGEFDRGGGRERRFGGGGRGGGGRGGGGRGAGERWCAAARRGRPRGARRQLPRHASGRHVQRVSLLPACPSAAAAAAAAAAAVASSLLLHRCSSDCKKLYFIGAPFLRSASPVPMPTLGKTTWV